MSSVLPEGWIRASGERARRLVDELQRELSTDHALSSVPVETLAYDGASDDVLFRRLDNPARFVVIHLTWSGSTEIDPCWPHIVFEGSFEEFVAYDSQHRDPERPLE